MQVRDILGHKGREVLDIAPDATLQDACGRLVEHNIGALVVRTADGRLEGIISERDIVRATAGKGREVLSARVSAHMTKLVQSCAETDAVEDIMETMTNRRLRHVPVLEEGRLVGIVSIGDVVKSRIEETVQEAENLRGYIASS